MWIVRLALRRPYTFVVAAMLVLILGIVTILRMPTDIFPEIDIPVVSVAFQFSGMAPDDMETHVVTNFEQAITTTVNDVEHIESQSLSGIGVIKIYFHPNVKIAEATAQVTAIAQTALRQMPPGMTPPLIMQYSATNVPIIQIGLASDTLPEEDVFDYGSKVIRVALANVQGAQMPYPYGGKQKQIMVDLDPERLAAWGISPSDVANAVNNQNLILPAGDAKIGKIDYPVRLNASPEVVAQMNDMPIKSINNEPVYLKDIGSVRDGFQVQTSIVHSDGKRGVLMSILKAGGASTLDIVKRVKEVLPQVAALGGDADKIKVTPLFDQSLYVRASINGVEREAAIAAGLTALMILVFLGSWRSTLIVVISIPLSILVSIILLDALGYTLNVMTLGGMALAVGILVDDATVEIENIHRNLHQHKRLVQAILDGASQIAVPAFVSTLCICIVFVPVFLLAGAAKFLFIPLALAVVFAMLTSYLLSRTLVPTMIHYLLASEVERYGGVLDPNDPHADPAKAHEKPHHATLLGCILWALRIFGGIVLAIVIGCLYPHFRTGLRAEWLDYLILLLAALAVMAALRYAVMNDYIWKFHDVFNAQFERFRLSYGSLLAWALEHRISIVVGFAVLVLVSCGLTVFIGTDFFPTVDAGEIRLHVRAPPGTRIEETERVFGTVEDVIHHQIPAKEIDTLMDNMGIPNSSINLSLSDGTLMSPADGEVLIALKPDHAPTEQYIDKINHALHADPRLINETFFFAPADMVTQVLNFGISAPIDIQIAGPQSSFDADYRAGQELATQIAALPGAADVHLQQVPATPDLRVDLDRSKESELGVTQLQVANNMLVSLSGTAQVAPNFWVNPATGFEYGVLVQTPQYDLDQVSELQNQPVASGTNTQLLSNLAAFSRKSTPANITHYNVLRTVDVLANVRGSDLGSVATGIDKILASYKLPPHSTLTVRGQVQSMRSSFRDLGFGLIFAILLVYLLMVINFQSWLDPLIILMALPGALSGILWMLFATGSTINVPSLMGAIMSIGVATSNSILMITFANDQRKEGLNSHDAALAAGMTRLRPVLMTALAMIIGMLPMSLGLGEGGEQNAPLGRAVIGGLLMATFATLFFVPVVYSTLRAKAPVTLVEEELR